MTGRDLYSTGLEGGRRPEPRQPAWRFYLAASMAAALAFCTAIALLAVDAPWHWARNAALAGTAIVAAKLLALAVTIARRLTRRANRRRRRRTPVP